MGMKGIGLACCHRYVVMAVSVAIAACAPSVPIVFNPSAHAKGDTFGYRQWIAERLEPDVVIIGIHGFSGASADYGNLGEHLMRHQPETGLYAYELRGQGSDPIRERRGDIGHPSEWYADLIVFTGLVRERHPGARIVWMGESMGALIATHAMCEAPRGKLPCDGLILSSPIVRYRDDIPAWTPVLVELAATALPLARVSLETLMGGQDVQMTEGTTHLKQAKKNPYSIEAYTLRLIGVLSELIDGMNVCARDLKVPLLLLHGGKDFINSDRDLRGFIARVPETTAVTYENYPQAHHLLMYDQCRDQVFKDLERWLNRLRRGRF